MKSPARIRATLAIVSASLVSACAAEAPAPPPPAPPEVTVAVPEKRDVQGYLEFTGNTVAFAEVEIVARVKGFLREIHFSPSDPVKKGQLLFSIEDEQYIADRDRAVADVRRWESELARAQADLERLQQAVESNAVSLSEVDRARADRDQADAERMAAEAQLVQAELSLSYTKIHSPMDGVVSRWFVDPGNLVGATESTVLTTVVLMQPIHAYWEMSESIFLRVLDEANRSGRADGDNTPDEGEFPVFLGTGSDEDWPHPGSMDFADTAVDTSTGTLQVRAVFDNNRAKLFPGLFARIRMPTAMLVDAVLIRESAVGTDLGGKYVYVVGDGDMVEQRYIQLGPKEGPMIVAASGLEHGERYIINGIQRARPGLPVTPTAGN
jgi:RND family efflux transporter MFP subunit